MFEIVNSKLGLVKLVKNEIFFNSLCNFFFHLVFKFYSFILEILVTEAKNYFLPHNVIFNSYKNGILVRKINDFLKLLQIYPNKYYVQFQWSNNK